MVLAESVTLATAKDDVFLAGTAKFRFEKFGSHGEDHLYAARA